MKLLLCGDCCKKRIQQAKIKNLEKVLKHNDFFFLNWSRKKICYRLLRDDFSIAFTQAIGCVHQMYKNRACTILPGPLLDGSNSQKGEIWTSLKISAPSWDFLVLFFPSIPYFQKSMYQQGQKWQLSLSTSGLM
jgi:hypothetical protein